MHGTFTHRITCNLYPDQYFQISHAARKFDMRVAPFLRDTALAALEQRSLLPAEFQKNLRGLIREIRRIGTDLNQKAENAEVYGRVTHDDLRSSGKADLALDRLVCILQHSLESLPDDHQVHESQDT